MELGLNGATVIITGAASGIGLACARAFASEGAKLGLIDLNGESVAALAAQLAVDGVEAYAVAADVGDEDAMAQAVNELASRLGSVRVAVGCAGISGPFGQKPEQITLEDFNKVLAVNVAGPFLLAKFALPWLRQSADAAIVFLGSDSAFVASPGMLPYNASKGAILQFTRALAVELVDDNIRVNTVCPSIVDTPMARRDLGVEEEGFVGAPFPVQLPAEVANHVLYLSSTASRPVNGTALVSDFGYLAQSSFPA